MPTKYLDMGGLTHYDTKIKAYVANIASGKVPYTGATSDVALGTHKITANTLNLSTTSGANTYTGTIQLTSSGALRMSANAVSKAYLFPTAQTEAEAVIAVQSWVNAQIDSAIATLDGELKAYADEAADGAYDTATQELGTRITNEATARANADTALGNRVTNLENAGHITKSVNNLENYYKKSEVYTKAEVVEEIQGTAFRFRKVNSLPAVSDDTVDTHTIFLVPFTSTDGNDAYEEWYLDGTNQRWERLGTTEMQLGNYVPTTRTVNGKALSSNIAIGPGDIAFDASANYGSGKLGTAVQNKVDKVNGKGLSTNDFTATLKNKLDGIASGAQVNVIEGVQLNGTDLTVSSKKVNVQIKRNGTALAVSSGAVDITVPTKVSDLTNDSGFITGVASITDAEIDALFAS